MKRFAVGMTLVAVVALLGPLGVSQPDAYVQKTGSMSPMAKDAEDLGVAEPNFPVTVNVGLDLRNKEALDAFLIAASTPGSPVFQQWLTQEQFNALYAPTPAQEQQVVDWLNGAGLKVSETFGNRLLVTAEGHARDVSAAFHVDLHRVRHGGIEKFAILSEPSFPANVVGFATGVTGLDNLVEPQARASLGSNCCHLSPNDLATFYHDGSTYDGTGQTIVIAGAYAWKASDQTTFNNQWGLAQLPTGSSQVCTGSGGSTQGCKFSAQNSIEVSLDVEYSHGTAPKAVVKNYMSKTTSWTDFQTMYNKVVTDNPGHTVTTSWGSCEPALSSSLMTANDNIFANGNAKGQSWFAASGDGGSDDCGNGGTSVDHPANSPHVMGTGGTNAFCSSGMTSGSPACGGYGSETAWSGSGGGASNTFGKPAWQTGCSVPADGKRDVPDVALESSSTQYGNYVINNGGWYIVGGTSGAAPQWAGFFAELNQKKGGSGLGLPGPRIYQLCGGASYHDITTGSNGAFAAAVGYDRVTGTGTIEATNFLANY